MDSTSLEGSPNTVQNSENSQVRRSPSPDPTKNLNNHFESVANQKYDSISELNKRGSMPSILHASHFDHDEIFVGEDDDFVFEVESPKLSNKMQMILQSNVNLSESIIQSTFKAVDDSRIKLEDRDLQVELEITELKLHHLEKKLEGCLQSSKSTLSMNAELSKNVSKILHSPSKRSQTMNLPEIKPRSSDSKLSPKTIAAINENGAGSGSQFFRSAQGINSSSPQTSNRLPPSGKKQVTEEAVNANHVHASVNVYEQSQPQTKSQNEGAGVGVEGRTITGTSIENNIKRNSAEITPGPNLNLETYLDNLKNSPYYFTFNQNQAKAAEEFAKNMSSDALQASIVDEAELLQNARHISETKKMALPGLNFNILPHNAQNQQELPPPYKAPPENNNYINTQDNVSLDYSEITTTNIQPPSESRNVRQHSQQDVFSQLVSQGPYGKQEIVLEDANKNQIVYVLKPKETLSFEKLETINIFFQAPASQIIDHGHHANTKITLNVPPTGKQTQIPGVESEVESLLTTENIITQSSPAKVKLSVIRESETGQNTSYSESQPAASENQQQFDESAQAMHLKLQLLNHPRCQKLLYGDDQYTVSNRGCSILQNRLESLDSGKKIITNRSDVYFKQKVHDFKNFLKEFEELLGSETIIPPVTQGSQQNSPQQPIKRLNSCDSERLNSGEARILENILEKYFSSPQKQTQQDDDVTVEQEQGVQEQIVVSSEVAAVIQPTKEKKLKKKKSLGDKKKGSKQPKVILNTSNLSSMTNSINQGSAGPSPAQKFQGQSPLDKILAGSSTLTFKHIDMIANPIKLTGVSSVKSDSIQYESTMKDTRKNSEVSTHIAETEVKSPMGAMVDYAQFSKLAKNPRSVSFASGKSSSMKTLPEQPQEVKLTKTKATASKSKISAKSSPKKSTSKPRSSSKTNKKAASATTSNQLDVLALLKPTGKKAKF